MWASQSSMCVCVCLCMMQCDGRTAVDGQLMVTSDPAAPYLVRLFVCAKMPVAEDEAIQHFVILFLILSCLFFFWSKMDGHQKP